MAGLMVSLEFRLHPMASALKVIGHRRIHLALLHPRGARADVTAPVNCIAAGGSGFSNRATAWDCLAERPSARPSDAVKLAMMLSACVASDLKRVNCFTHYLLSGLVLLMNSGPALAQTFFRRPPTEVSIHNPSSTEGQSNRTTLSVLVPKDAGAELERMVLSQLVNIDSWDWGRRDPEIYLGDYGLRRRGEPGLAEATISEGGNELSIHFDPAIEPGQRVNVAFRGFNPDANIYQWTTTFIPTGSDPIPSNGPTLRLSIDYNEHYR